MRFVQNNIFSRLIIGKENFNILKDGSISFPFLEAIYLGCRIENSLKQHIVQFAISNNIAVYQAKKNSEKFNFEFIVENKKPHNKPLIVPR